MYAVTAGGMADAFLYAVAGAAGAAVVAAAVAVFKWLRALDEHFDRSMAWQQSVDTRMAEANLRLASVEHEVTTNEGGSLKDSVAKIGKRFDDHLIDSARGKEAIDRIVSAGLGVVQEQHTMRAELDALKTPPPEGP